MRAAALLACVCVAGCQHLAFGYNSGGVSGSGSRASGDGSQARAFGARVSVAGGERLLTGIVVAVLLAEGVRYYLRGDDGTMTPLDYVPGPDPGRRIAAQDCTRPIDTGRGNLMCR